MTVRILSGDCRELLKTLPEAVLEEAAKRLDREWPGPASSIVRALAETAIKSIEDKDTNG